MVVVVVVVGGGGCSGGVKADWRAECVGEECMVPIATMAKWIQYAAQGKALEALSSCNQTDRRFRTPW